MTDSLIADNFRYAGFWIRLVAAIIDAAILLIALWILGFVIGVDLSSIERTEADVTRIRVLWVALIFLAWLYYAAMESMPPQGTVGKLLMGIYVTDLEGDRLKFSRASVRYWVRYLSAFIVFIGFFMAMFTRRRQALHDIVAQALVLKR